MIKTVHKAVAEFFSGKPWGKLGQCQLKLGLIEGSLGGLPTPLVRSQRSLC